jgi:glycosyltransferase involved in cell wall biosynthesis
VNIVFASHTEIGGTFVVGSHHLAREFARLGHRVAHLGPPISLAHLIRIGRADVRRRFALWARGGEMDRDGVLNYVGLSPLPWRLALKLGRGGWNLYARTLPSMRRVLERAGMWPVDALLVDQPQLAGIETLLRPRLLVYRATDLYGQMMSNPVVDAAERRIARAARLLVGTSEPVLAHLRSIASAPAMLLENGVEFDRFAATTAAPPEYRDIPAPRAVYAGALDERFDVGAIETLAQAGGVSVVLIGPASAGVAAALASRPNVFLLGPRRYESLPAYLQHAQIGLLPLTAHPANEGRSPMKLFEYGAAGLPVVATATRELSRRALPFVVLAEDAADFRKGVSALLQDSGRCRALGAAARQISRSYGWRERAATLARALKQMETGAPEEEVPGELATISGFGTDY